MIPPLLLHYYITLRCNCQCTFCDIQKPVDADYSDIVQNLRHGRDMHIPFVDFTGGEPLLHPQLPDMLEQAQHLGYRTSVTTNALLYPERAEELKGLINFFHISLDSLDPAQHNSIRGRPVYDRVMQSLDTAVRLGEQPDILYTVTPQTIGQLDAMVRFAQQLRLVLILNPVFTRSKLEPEHLAKLERYAASPFIYVNKAFHHLRRNGGNQIQSPRCRVMDAAVVISPDNKLLLPCFHYAQTALPITGPLAALRQQPEWKYYQKNQGRLSVCQGCDLNCYFDPSFHYQFDIFFLESIVAKMRYTYHKRKPPVKTASALLIAEHCRKKA
ncbi:MAG: radical SAM protein [candidate division KSB1 bacterium]|nr:radical SAM protein [candidate division KSB1 bacterium]